MKIVAQIISPPASSLNIEQAINGTALHPAHDRSLLVPNFPAVFIYELCKHYFTYKNILNRYSLKHFIDQGLSS
jgi:hypothetical protein